MSGWGVKGLISRVRAGVAVPTRPWDRSQRVGRKQNSGSRTRRPRSHPLQTRDIQATGGADKDGSSKKHPPRDASGRGLEPKP